MSATQIHIQGPQHTPKGVSSILRFIVILIFLFSFVVSISGFVLYPKTTLGFMMSFSGAILAYEACLLFMKHFCK